MFTQTHYPQSILPEELDEYLSKGWFRMGQMIFTCHFICLQGALYSPIWMRMPLADYTFRKRQRKNMRQVESLFRIEIRPAEINQEKEELYTFHKNRFSGFISETLVESLLEFPDKNIYQTYEVVIYDDEKLIAASFFDLGDNSAASILGMFHPDYAKYSLGFYTMLAEVKYAQELGLEYYYPGYVVHQYPKFDYKLRVGEMDYFDLESQKWLPYKNLDVNKLPAVALQNRLEKMQKLLNTFNIDNHRLLYPLHDKIAGHEHQNAFMITPMFIACHYHYLNEQVIVIEYDLVIEAYRLSIYRRVDDLLFFFPFLIEDSYDFDNTYFEYLLREYTIVESDLPEMILYALENVKPRLEGRINA
ncbi:MAG: GNAT family N-acetyltransferase [Chitinophagales bacterium]